ncbi:MAG: S-adenosylmethionine decarboxylase [Gemmatimonadota bacterium]
MNFTHRVGTLTGIAGSRLADPEALSGVIIAAAAAIGMSSHGPPVVKSGPRGVVAGLLCHGGHVVIHALPEESQCAVDILAMEPGSAERGMEVIAKRLNATGRTDR